MADTTDKAGNTGRADETGKISVPQGQEDTPQNTRHHERRSVLWGGSLLVGQHEFACHIYNLSLGGARIRLDLPLEPGTKVFLRLPNRDDIAAQIVWRHNIVFGMKFLVSHDRVKEVFSDRLHIISGTEVPTMDGKIKEEK